jgi:hypothetical protein
MSNKITIDLSKYCTQADFAREKEMKLCTVSQWVKRAKDGTGTAKIEYLDIPELSLTLVKRI